jgi:hypothetical protein
MAFKIIQYKQELFEVAQELVDQQALHATINALFNDFMGAANIYTKAQRNLLSTIKFTLLQELNENNECIDNILDDDTTQITKLPGLQFNALSQLQNFNALLDPSQKQQFSLFLKNINKALINYSTFEAIRVSLLAELNNLNKKETALNDFMRKIQDIPLENIASLETKSMADYLKMADTLRELQGLARNFVIDSRPIALKVRPFQNFFAKRWQEIYKTPAEYCANPQNKFNQFCVTLAGIIAESVPDLGRYSLLMPTQKVLKSDITYTYFDDPALPLHHFILSDDGTRFIEIQPCFIAAEEDAVFKHTVLIDGDIKPLSNDEAERLIDHSILSSILTQQIKDYRDFTTSKDKLSMGSQMMRLAEALLTGGVHNSSTRLANTDHRKADHLNAGEAANIGILAFAEYLKKIPPEDVDKLMALSSKGLSENFGQIWRRLTTPGAIDLLDTSYCVELLAPNIKAICQANPEVFTLGKLTLEGFKQNLSTAKENFLKSINSKHYKILRPVHQWMDEIKMPASAQFEEFIKVAPARDLLKLLRQHFTVKEGTTYSVFLNQSVDRLEYLNRCVEAGNANFVLRLLQLQQKMLNAFSPAIHSLGTGMRNNIFYDRFYPYVFDSWDYLDDIKEDWAISSAKTRYQYEPDTITLTKQVCTYVYLGLTIIPYLLVHAASSLANIATGEPWNAGPEGDNKEWNDLSDLGRVGRFTMHTVNVLVFPVIALIAGTSTVFMLAGMLAIKALQVAALPILAVDAAISTLANPLKRRFNQPRISQIMPEPSTENDEAATFNATHKNIRTKLKTLQVVPDHLVEKSEISSKKSVSSSQSSAPLRFWESNVADEKSINQQEQSANKKPQR